MTKDELNKQVLFWNPKNVFAEQDGYKLLLDIDAFNMHMTWNVEWKEGGYDCYQEFGDFASARDYFLEKVNG